MAYPVLAQSDRSESPGQVVAVKCRCRIVKSGRHDVHEMTCAFLADFFEAEDLLSSGEVTLRREEGEDRDDFIQRVLRAAWGIYYPWRLVDETGGD